MGNILTSNYDNDHDGSWWEDGDDQWGIKGGGSLEDGFYRSSPPAWMRDTPAGGTMDTVGAASHTNPSGVGDYYFEFYHPLDTTDDSHDFSLSIGDTVGFEAVYYDNDLGSSRWWPESFPLADIVIAAPPVGGEIVSINLLQIMVPYILLFFTFIAGLAATLYRRSIS